jgi:acetoacetyl-CoA reductase
MSRIALVTGGTRGIGGAISIALKSAGYKVAANYASRDDVAESFANGIFRISRPAEKGWPRS